MAQLRLSQVVALDKGAKAQGESALTKVFHEADVDALWNGSTKTYQPRADDGEMLQSEVLNVRLRSQDVLTGLVKELTRLYDVAATRDEGNMIARASVVVDGVIVLENLPVPTLIYLEKKLADLRQFLLKLPVLDSAVNWTWDEGQGLFKSDPIKTVSTAKVPQNHVKAPATDKHPAQVDVLYQDVPVGDWTRVKYSGALQRTKLAELLERVVTLSDAVKKAREEANSTMVEDIHIGAQIFEFLGW